MIVTKGYGTKQMIITQGYGTISIPIIPSITPACRIIKVLSETRAVLLS